MRAVEIAPLILIAVLACAGCGTPVNPAGTVACGDVIEVTWTSDDAYRVVSHRVRVNDRGDVYMPWNGSFNAAGLTTRQVAAKVPAIFPNCLTSPDYVATVAIVGHATRPAIFSHYQPADVLQISIHDVYSPGDVVTVQTRIARDGTVALPLIEPIQLAGMSDASAPKAIEDAYRSNKMIENAIVFVLKIDSH